MFNHNAKYRIPLFWFILFLFIAQGFSKQVFPGESVAVEIMLTKIASVEVFPGDTIDYTISYENTGTDTATGVSILDTLSRDVTFINATEPFIYHPDTPPTIEWELGILPPGESGNIGLQVYADSLLEDEAQIINTAWIFSDQGISNMATMITSNILPMTINLSANPTIIPGDGVSSSTLTAQVFSFLGNPVPDGLPVSFTEAIGTIVEGKDTVDTQGGIAQSTIISDVMISGSQGAIINGRANFSLTKFASDTTRVVFMMGAFEGAIIDYAGNPVSDAVVDLIREDTGNSIHSDTTGADGLYRILVHIRDDYRLAFQTIDEFGYPIIIEQPVIVELPDSGEIEPSLNAISGWLYNENTGKKIPEAGIPVFLSSLEDTTGLGENEIHRDTTYTDSTGFYCFVNIPSGQYEVDVFYMGTLSYKDGQINVDLSIPGKYITDANVPLVRSPFYTYKIVDRPAVERGDTLTYTIYYGSIDTDISERVFIVDNLPEELSFLESEDLYQTSESVRFESYDPLTNHITFYRDGLQLDEGDSIIFKARVDGDMSAIDPLSQTGYITNINFVTNLQDTTLSDRDIRSRARTRLYLDLLSVKKVVSHKAAEQGDMLTYTVRIKNTSDEITVREITVMDVLPYGFRYRSNRSYWNSEKIDNPIEENHKQRVGLTWTLDDTLVPGESGVLKYRTVVGLSSRYGESENRVYATAITEGGTLLHSQEALAPVVIRPGMLNSLGLIFGKVYYDLNVNTLHDSDEPVVGDIEIIMEDGTRVTTDEFGKYSIPNVRSGDHVLRINRTSLPTGTQVLLNSPDFLGDARSRLVKVSPGGIAKANFAIETLPEPEPELESEPEPEMLQELGLSLSQETTIKIRQYSQTEDYRLVVLKPMVIELATEFLPGEATISPEITAELSQIADFLEWKFDSNVEIVGHTDNVPPPTTSIYTNNLELSQARVDAIRNYLDQERNILPNRMTAIGRGDTESIADNSTEEGRASNRRIEFRFIIPSEDIPEVKELRFNTVISYPDDLPLSQVRLHSILPPGWTYADNSGSFGGFSMNPATITDRNMIWDLGELREQPEVSLGFGLFPVDYSQIPEVSTVKSYLEFTDPGGTIFFTDTLTTSLTTVVNEITFRMVLAGASFDVNQWDIKPPVIVLLDGLGKFLSWQTDVRMKIEGYTDSTGSLEWNIELSQNRAASARDHLVQTYGLSPDRIEVGGFGPQSPVADNSTVDGRALNRRVEFLVMSDFQQPQPIKVIVLAEDSLEQEVSLRRELTDPPRDVFRMPAGEISSFSLNIDFMGLQDIDLVNITFDIPEGLAIQGETDEGDRLELQSWMFKVQRGWQLLIREFQIIKDAGLVGERAIPIQVQPYSNNVEKYGLTSRILNIRIE